jgi:Ni,Fe-hydrogenase maturation factor
VTTVATPTRVLVVGFGNSLMADDGAGPEVVRRLNDGHLPAGVRVEDGGADSLRLPGLWRGEPDIWLAVPQRHATAHALSLPEGLRWISLSYPEMAAVRYRFWGIMVRRLSLVSGLSDEVGVAVERVVQEILRNLGH